jgi:5-oxoprolinase (ATP-hydrolysing)
MSKQPGGGGHAVRRDRTTAPEGTMNNFTFGNEQHQYYETIAGGSGAGPDHDGPGRQTRMTNIRLTDPEILKPGSQFG